MTDNHHINFQDGVAEDKLCPDGLFFNDQLTGYPRYPCSYPQDVQCGSRTRTRKYLHVII